MKTINYGDCEQEIIFESVQEEQDYRDKMILEDILNDEDLSFFDKIKKLDKESCLSDVQIIDWISENYSAAYLAEYLYEFVTQ